MFDMRLVLYITGNAALRSRSKGRPPAQGVIESHDAWIRVARGSSLVDMNNIIRSAICSKPELEHVHQEPFKAFYIIPRHSSFKDGASIPSEDIMSKFWDAAQPELEPNIRITIVEPPPSSPSLQDNVNDTQSLQSATEPIPTPSSASIMPSPSAIATSQTSRRGERQAQASANRAMAKQHEIESYLKLLQLSHVACPKCAEPGRVEQYCFAASPTLHMPLTTKQMSRWAVELQAKRYTDTETPPHYVITDMESRPRGNQAGPLSTPASSSQRSLRSVSPSSSIVRRPSTSTLDFDDGMASPTKPATGASFSTTNGPHLTIWTFVKRYRAGMEPEVVELANMRILHMATLAFWLSRHAGSNQGCQTSNTAHISPMTLDFAAEWVQTWQQLPASQSEAGNEQQQALAEMEAWRRHLPYSIHPRRISPTPPIIRAANEPADQPFDDLDDQM